MALYEIKKGGNNPLRGYPFDIEIDTHSFIRTIGESILFYLSHHLRTLISCYPIGPFKTSLSQNLTSYLIWPSLHLLRPC
jgi:hypothetical protein